MSLVEPFADTRGRVAVKRAIEIFCNIPEMWLGQHIVQGPEGMIRRQGLGVIDVERRSADRP